MTGRSPLKQPGVPSKETAAEHARRIAKTRAAYASMSRRGGALHGALRPGSAASDRGAPRDPRPPFSSRETGVDSAAAPPGGRSAFATGRSVDVLAALAYARGAERATPRRFAVARESDDDDDDDDNAAPELLDGSGAATPWRTLGALALRAGFDSGRDDGGRSDRDGGDGEAEEEVEAVLMALAARGGGGGGSARQGAPGLVRRASQELKDARTKRLSVLRFVEEASSPDPRRAMAARKQLREQQQQQSQSQQQSQRGGRRDVGRWPVGRTPAAAIEAAAFTGGAGEEEREAAGVEADADDDAALAAAEAHLQDLSGPAYPPPPPPNTNRAVPSAAAAAAPTAAVHSGFAAHVAAGAAAAEAGSGGGAPPPSGGGGGPVTQEEEDPLMMSYYSAVPAWLSTLLSPADGRRRTAAR